MNLEYKVSWIQERLICDQNEPYYKIKVYEQSRYRFTNRVPVCNWMILHDFETNHDASSPSLQSNRQRNFYVKVYEPWWVHTIHNKKNLHNYDINLYEQSRDSRIKRAHATSKRRFRSHSDFQDSHQNEILTRHRYKGLRANSSKLIPQLKYSRESVT